MHLFWRPGVYALRRGQWVPQPYGGPAPVATDESLLTPDPPEGGWLGEDGVPLRLRGISGDGATLVWRGGREGGIYLSGPAGENLRRITTARAAGYQPPVFSPDDRWLAYQTRDEIRLYELATGRDRNLVSHFKGFGSMAWAPDSRRLTYVGWTGCRLNRSYLVDGIVFRCLIEPFVVETEWGRS